MSSTGERMLELLALLQRRHRWSGEELSERLGVSRRTLRRDVDRLRELGYPVESDRGVDGGYQLGVGTKLPPLLLTADEAVAIAIGLRTAANQSVEGLSEPSMGALVKVGQLLSDPLQHRVESLTGAIEAAPSLSTATVALSTLTTLARATRDTTLVRFGYQGFDGTSTERYVEPHHVVPLNRYWYLIAWDLDRDDWRTFRLDRVGDPHVTRRTFGPRTLPAPDPTTHIRQTIAALKSVHDVELVIEAPLAEVLPHIGPWGAASAVDDRTTRIEMHIPDLAWAVLMLAITNATIVSIEPAELRDFLGELGGRFQDVSSAIQRPG
ncbi:MAG: YafY family protein [Actinomycetota bacterium]